MKKILLSVLLLINLGLIANAEIYREPQTILLVGVHEDELEDYEKVVLRGKRVVEIPKSNDWYRHVASTNSQEVLLKQNTGFVGLYTPNGSLVRPIDMIGQKKSHLDSIPPVTYQPAHQMANNRYGYATGGRVDPFQSGLVADKQDHKRLSPGYGYNSQQDRPGASKKSKFLDMLNFFPIDVVTPFNYPGNYDQTGIFRAYGLGVLPHVGGLVAARNRAKAEKEDYDYYRQQVAPSYMGNQNPSQYNYQAHQPDSPIPSDPKFLEYEQMPQSWTQQYPNYGEQPLNNYNSPN